MAIIELAAAALLAKLMVPMKEPASTNDHAAMHHHMAAATHPGLQWNWVQATALGFTLATLAWWGRSRHPVAALSTAAGLLVLAASRPVRVLATQSHLVAMTALEVLIVVIPLLVLKRRSRTGVEEPSTSRGLTVLTGVAAMLYAGMVLVIHLPPLHYRSAQIGAVPLWVVGSVTLVGFLYWTAVLGTEGRVSLRVRRAALLGAQELTAFVGLLAIFGSWTSMNHASVLGISGAWDQRLGGILMMVTCAAVAIPIARRLGPPAED